MCVFMVNKKEKINSSFTKMYREFLPFRMYLFPTSCSIRCLHVCFRDPGQPKSKRRGGEYFTNLKKEQSA